MEKADGLKAALAELVDDVKSHNINNAVYDFIFPASTPTTKTPSFTSTASATQPICALFVILAYRKMHLLPCLDNSLPIQPTVSDLQHLAGVLQSWSLPMHTSSDSSKLQLLNGHLSEVMYIP